MSQYSLLQQKQKHLCEKYNATYCESVENLKLGISLNVKEGILPINGLRIHPEQSTTGWYIWAGGEMSEADDFFVPLHVAHVEEWVPGIKKYLGLSPGWRFLILNKDPFRLRLKE